MATSSLTPCLSPALSAGLACFGLGAARRIDPGFKAFGAALCVLAFTASPAFADQFVEAADNAKIDCVLSRGELTRIALVGDGFANVSKIASAYPYNDFTVTHEPVRGDIYISVPDGFTKPNLSFFGTTRKGFVYKFLCQVRGNDAEQVFVTNTAIKAEQARDWEVQSSPEDTAVRLAQAMYRSEAIDGFEIRQSVLEPVAVGKLEVQQVGEYRGAELKGLILRVRNTGREALPLDENLLAGRTSVAFMTPVSQLAPGQVAAVYLIQSNGAQ